MSESEPEDYIDSEALREYLREETDLQVGTGARDKLKAHLEDLASSIWNQAAIRASETGNKRIQEDHVGEAFGDLVRHHDEIGEAAREVRDLYQRLDDLAEQTPLYIEYEGEKDE